jgi:hypothetical protein
MPSLGRTRSMSGAPNRRAPIAALVVQVLFARFDEEVSDVKNAPQTS